MLAKLTFLAGLAAAADFTVKVGEGGNVFVPSTIAASVGDTVSFHFTGSNHDVVQSTFDAPCAPKDGGFHVPATADASAVFVVNVTTPDPVYFYCSVNRHCNLGMVGVINAK